MKKILWWISIEFISVIKKNDKLFHSFYFMQKTYKMKCFPCIFFINHIKHKICDFTSLIRGKALSNERKNSSTLVFIMNWYGWLRFIMSAVKLFSLRFHRYDVWHLAISILWQHSLLDVVSLCWKQNNISTIWFHEIKFIRHYCNRTFKAFELWNLYKKKDNDWITHGSYNFLMFNRNSDFTDYITSNITS